MGSSWANHSHLPLLTLKILKNLLFDGILLTLETDKVVFTLICFIFVTSQDETK